MFFILCSELFVWTSDLNIAVSHLIFFFYCFYIETWHSILVLPSSVLLFPCLLCIFQLCSSAGSKPTIDLCFPRLAIDYNSLYLSFTLQPGGSPLSPRRQLPKSTSHVAYLRYINCAESSLILEWHVISEWLLFLSSLRSSWSVFLAS